MVEVRDRPHLLQQKTSHVSTADGAMGEGSDIFIWDTVVTTFNTRADLGFILDERRYIVAATPAQQVLVILGSEQILDGKLIEPWDENKGLRFFNTDEAELPDSKLFIILYLESLEQNSAGTEINKQINFVNQLQAH